MTETQAKSGAAGASTTPDANAADAGGGSATGRAAVGRAVVPADAPSPKFTRAPGMPPPPDKPGENDNSSDEGGSESAAGSSSSSAAAAAGGSGSGSGSGSGGKSPVSVSSTLGGLSSGTKAAGSPAGGSGVPPTITRPGAAGAGRPGAGGPAAGQSAAAGAGGASAVGAARVTEAVRTARSTVAGGAARGPRRARLNVKRIDPWSVFKFAFAVSLVLFIVVIVATSVLYLALDAMGVFEKVNTSLGDLISASGGSEGSTFKITAKGVIGTSALIGVVNVVLFTALATLGAFIYNVCADLVGGVELTLAERD
ncbi:DUF3566 domain-containing protein [Asanoa siamensis]|uniref:DUF3566 domain-containing protein n=1 Tax=Asanoa siamensis TaxID=926357 RepID=A0ABQ4CIQ3_9ACTN|nr:DUF3566 domain-containing protein [Asanoa siamensis]GIF71178.1 hypothetical protein Asi02nite_06960 [Asanoa siamensis]